MRNPVTAVLMGVMLVVVVGNVSAQIAGSTTTGISVEELKTIARGWSATKPSSRALSRCAGRARRECEFDDAVLARRGAY